ncbi:general substrate transporter [Crucibulum laeve]|uniref:General substrate transporter n=1 Tax=Crucibulum laeve TaxID=68775 RepID=A0A5C3MED6_9AGAR|nr:general substrate transporter [Crucibulum laeve]
MSHPRFPNGETFTKYGWGVCLWVLITAFQYGYHISALNQIQAVLTCNDTTSDVYRRYGLPTCIPMSDFTFSLVTSIFTVGGLTGSLVANLVMDKHGRKGATKICAVTMAAGTGLMGVSSSVGFLALGRFLVGISSGVGLCVGPVFLGEIAPSKISGNVGVLTQLAIVLGIMLTQVAGLRLSTPTEWRIVLLISFALAVIQFIASAFATESPSWLASKGRLEENKSISVKLWGEVGINPSSRDVEDPLLDEAEERRRDVHQDAVTIPQLFVARDLRKPLMIVCLAMLSQQLSGINAVLYYSNAILSRSLPDLGPYVSLGITIVNVIMTFPPILLIERMGRRSLLTLSTFGSLFSLFAIGIGLDSGLVLLSSIATLTFVTSFAVGLGPIPFVMISEVSPPHAVSVLSSVALSLNWIANFCVGLAFLPLRNILSGGDPLKEGRVFYVFVALLFTSTFLLSRYYRG